MIRLIGRLACALPLLAAISAFADNSVIQLQAFPTISVADSKSTIEISAIVREPNGQLAPTGTSVVFTTTLGTFRQSVVTAINGVANATLVAGAIPGIANITVTSAGSSPSTLTYEFVGSRSELSSAKEYVEIYAPALMQYAHGDRIISASALHRGVTLRYKELEIQADDLEYDINTYIVKARHAHLRYGKLSKDFDQLSCTLNSRHGYGTASYQLRVPDTFAQQGKGLVFLSKKADGTYQIAPLVERYGVVEFHSDWLSPYRGVLAPDLFSFTDLSNSPSTISARRAVVYPRKQIQFQSAEIYVANAKIIKLPLFVVNFNQSSGPMLTDGLLSFNNSQVGINYPQYLMLRPGLTSDLRFHMGDQYGRGFGSDRGEFLDYELAWDKGDDMQGGLALSGIGRDDWSFDAHQYWRFDDKTNANAQLSLPSGSGFFGAGSIGHQFNGFSTNLNASHSQTFTGLISSSQSYSADITTDPKKVANLPIRTSYGYTATSTSSDDSILGTRDQTGQGVTARAVTDGIKLDRSSVLTSSVTVSKLYGPDEPSGLTVLGSVNLNRQISRQANLLMTYNYTQDGFNDVELGRHNLSLQGNYHAGKLSFDFLGSKGIGVNTESVYSDVSYHLGNLWRLAYSYTDNEILGTDYLDWDLGINYRIGWREVGLMWSQRTRRIGLQLLGTQF